MRARASAADLIRDGGLPGARAYYAQNRARPIELVGLADALRAAGHVREADAVASRVALELRVRLGAP